VVLGAGYGVLGAFIIVYAIVRTRNVDVALRADGPIEPDWWAIVTITAATLALAVATIVIVLAEL